MVSKTAKPTNPKPDFNTNNKNIANMEKGVKIFRSCVFLNNSIARKISMN